MAERRAAAPRADPVRFLARALCVVFGLVGFLPLVAEALLGLDSMQRWAARETTRVLHEQLGLTASFAVRLHLIPLRLRIDHLVVPASDGGGPALEVERLSVSPRVFGLLAGRLDVGDVEIHAPRARLVVREGKIVNVRYRLPETPKTDREMKQSPFGSLAVSEARLALDLDGTRVDTGPVDVDVFAEAGPAFEVMLSAGATTIDRARRVLRPAEGEPAISHDEDRLCRVDLRARVHGGDLLVRRLSALGAADLDPREKTRPACDRGDDADERVALRLSGVRLSLREGERPYVAGHVVVRAPLGLVNRFASTQPLSGWAAFRGDVRFDGQSRLPEIHGRLSGARVAFERYRLAEDLAVDVELAADVVRIPRYEMGFADGRVVLENARIEPFAEGAPLSVERVDGKGILFESMMRDLGVTPDTIVRWTLASTRVTKIRGTLAPLKIDADLAGETKDFEVFDRAYHDKGRRHMIGVKSAALRGKIGVRPNALLISDTRADFGKSSMFVKLVSIGFDNTLELDVAKGSKLNLADISPLIDIKMAGQAELDVRMAGLASDPLLTGNVKILGFEFGGFPLGDLKSGKVKFKPLWLEIADLEGTKGTSDFVVPAARLDFGTRASLVVEARALSDSLDVRDFFHMWHFADDPRFQAVEGHTKVDASIRYVLGGPEDRCQGGLLRTTGVLGVKDLSLFDERYDGGRAKFDFFWDDRDAAYRGVTLDVPELVLQKGKGALAGSLSMRPGAVVSGEFTANQVPLAKFDALPAMLRAAEGTVSATAKVGGTLDALEADVNASISSVRVGRAVLAPSLLRVQLFPVVRAERPIGTTRCGQPISAPFDKAAYDRDPLDGVFQTSGSLFGGQITLKDVSLTRQRKKTVRGTIGLSELDLGAFSELVPELALSTPRLTGRASALIRIDELAMEAPSLARGKIELSQLSLERGGVRAELLPTPAPVAFADGSISVPSAALAITSPRGQRAVFDLSGRVAGVSSSATVDAQIAMRPTPLASLVGILPRVERASGSLSGRLRLSGPLSAPRYAGGLELEHGELSVRGLSTPVSELELALGIDGSELSIRKGSFRLGGGRVALSGGAPLRGFSLGEARVRVAAREIALPMRDGVRALADAELLVTYRPADGGQKKLPRVVGNVLLRSLEYRRPVTMAADLSALAQRGKRTEFEVYDPSEDAVEFDLVIKAQRSLVIENDLVDAELLLADEGLELAGTNARYGLRGEVKIKPGGRIVLRRSEFEIREGSVRFDDLTRIAPQVDVTAVTEYRRYSDAPGSGLSGQNTTSTATTTTSATGGRWTIRMHAHGDADNLKVDLSSDPALAQDDIFLLLTVGLTRAELDQAQSASVGESVALEALGTLTGADRAVKDAVPLIDEFRFGSAYSSRTGRTEPTVTVGKRLTERVRANVTSGLAESREIRSNLEWRLSPRVSIEGSYDNVNDISSSSLGNLGADVRWRLEFE